MPNLVERFPDLAVCSTPRGASSISEWSRAHNCPMPEIQIYDLELSGDYSKICNQILNKMCWTKQQGYEIMSFEVDANTAKVTFKLKKEE